MPRRNAARQDGPRTTIRSERRETTRGPFKPFWDALFRLLRFIGKRVHGFYATVGIFLLIGAIAAIIGVTLFVKLAGEVREGETQAFDDAVMHWFGGIPYRTALEPLMLEITMLGTGSVVLTVVAVSGMFLWLTRHRYSAMLLFVATAVGLILNNLLKLGFDRDRPQVFEWGTTAMSSSFPSGHAMSAATVYVTVAYLAARLQRSRRARWATIAFALLLVVLIAVSRVYLGVHYPTDVAAGIVLGVAWAGFCMAMLEAIQIFARREASAAEQAQEERAPGGL